MFSNKYAIVYLCSMNGISFVYQTPFRIEGAVQTKKWIGVCLTAMGYAAKQLSFAFMDDHALLRINKDFLKHDYFTDVITFDYSVGKELSCDIAISVDRVQDNAQEQKIDFAQELRRVMIHGVLHCCGYGDKSPQQIKEMREKENECLAMFHVEPKTQKHV